MPSIDNAGFLYLLSDRAGTDYAWSIALPASAAFLGAGYVAGPVVTMPGLTVTRSWRPFRLVYPGVILLGVALRAKQIRELVIPSATVLASALLLLTLRLRYPLSKETGPTDFWSLMLLHIVLAAESVWMVIWSLRRMQESSEQL